MNFVRITNYPDYVIHPCGTILRICKSKTTELKHSKMKKGYMRVHLYKNGEKTKGGICKTKYGWQWIYRMDGKQKGKNMKSLEALEIYRKKKLISLQT